MPFRFVVLAAALLALPAPAQELTPEKAAEIDRDQKKAQDQVSKKYGNKKSNELSSDERKAMIRDQADADRAVLDKHGVSAKEFSRYSASQSRDDRARTKDAAAALEKKEQEAAEKEKQQAAAAQPQDIPVQRGFGDGKTVELEAQEGAPPVVEQGLPDGDKQDFEDAAASGGGARGDEPRSAPSRGKGKGKGKRGR